MTVGSERAFLPAALELEQTPASPAGRAIMLVIATLFVLAVSWAALGHVDIVAVAPGKLIASGQSKSIQALETGQVVSINAHEGQAVNADDVLVRLDTRVAEAELNRVVAALDDAENDVRRYRTLARWAMDPELARDQVDSTGAGLLRHTWDEHKARIAVLSRERGRLLMEQESVRQQVKKLEAILPIVETRTADQQRLVENRLLPETDYLDAEQRRLEVAHDLGSQRATVQKLGAAIVELEARVTAATSEFRRRMIDEHEQALRRRKALLQEGIKAKARLAAKTIRSPVDGVVQQLAVHHHGAVVSPAQTLMVVVPNEATLEVEATLENKDIGFVGVGQATEVKIDAFPFTRYGSIDGKVVGLSSDAISDEVKGMVYEMRVRLDRSDMDVNGQRVPLFPGMTVTVEAITGRRRLIDYILSPLMRYQDESVRER